MKSRAFDLFLVFAFLVSSQGVWAQRGASSRNGPQPADPTSFPQTSSPEESLGHIFLSGKVVVDDGTELPEAAEIQTICNGARHTETHTNKKGNFSFEFDNHISTLEGGQSEEDASVDTSRTPGGDQRNLHECQLQAVLSGFSSQTIQIGSRLSGYGSSDLGRIVLHRLTPAEGATVSVTSAKAPAAAKKAFAKGNEQEQKRQLEEAQRSFEKAVQIYPEYAEAWFELGRVRLLRNDTAGAQQAFSKAQVADPAYVSPYRGLCELAMRAKDWPEMAKITKQLLDRYPDSFPDMWLYNALGNYYVGDLSGAEQSARRGVKLDQAHQVPKLEYLLAMIVFQRHDYSEAETHMQQFLQLSTAPADVAEAKRQLAEITRLAGTTKVGGSSDKQ